MILMRLTVLCLFMAPLYAHAENYDALVQKYAALNQLDAALVHAVIQQESNYDPKAVSKAGAQGLMQLMPATAKRFGVSNAFDPEQNIRAGSEYLAWLLQRFDGEVRLALAGYNAGEGNVDRYGGIPPFRETQNYVASVMQRYQASHTAKPKPLQPAARTSASLPASVSRIRSLTLQTADTDITRFMAIMGVHP